MIKTLTVILALFSGLTVYAQNYQTQGVFMYSFVRNIQWPESEKQGNFEIVVLGETPMLDELKTMAEKKKGDKDRTIVVTKIKSLAEFKKAQILFIPAEKSSQLADALAKVGDRSTLIVTEQAGLGAKGSDINFIKKDNKLAFELNQATLAKHKLKAAIDITRLAIII